MQTDTSQDHRTRSFALLLLRLTVRLESLFNHRRRWGLYDREPQADESVLTLRTQEVVEMLGKRPAMLLAAFQQFGTKRVYQLSEDLQRRIRDCSMRLEMFVTAIQSGDQGMIDEFMVLWDRSMGEVSLDDIGMSSGLFASIAA